MSSDGTSGFSGGNEKFLNDRVDRLNEGLRFLGLSPIKKRKLKQKRYSKEKVKKITETIKKKVFHANIDDPDDVDEVDDNVTILRTLQESFNTSTDRSHKVKILSIFRHWSYPKIQVNFPTATRHMITIAKNIAKDKGILGDPNPKNHPSLGVDVINSIMNFYQSDEHTQIMPGKKDFVSVIVDGHKIQMQKRLILNNLKELYELFKKEYPKMKCSFSKFASLRPKHCVLARSQWHSFGVCVSDTRKY